MVELSTQSCEACRIDAPRVSEEEISSLMLEIPNWNLEKDSINKLKRVFNFSDYQSAIDFSNGVAKMADLEDHHPQIVLEWGKVTVVWWSHKIKGLHKNDFICASKTDNLFTEN